jgi:lipopolysaccharide transport system permease protein
MRDHPVPTHHIHSGSSYFNWQLPELWRYRDLLIMFVKRDLVATYKQTVLGPLWFFIQPLLVTITFSLVFGRFAGLSTDGMPRIMFYLSGITIWNYFSECFTKTATVFKDNTQLFGKVYFPRAIMPLSIVVGALVKFLIQMLLFMGFFFYYYLKPDSSLSPNVYLLLLPLLVFMMAGFALGAGMLVAATTIKYRDLSYLISFGVQLLMFATPVIYSISTIRPEYKYLVQLNPLSCIVESFRYGFLGVGTVSSTSFLYSGIIMLLLLVSGFAVFTKAESAFMDTI